MKYEFQDYIIRQQISSRGGGIEISLTEFGYPSHRMTAYQNYLGGGLLGRVQSDCTIPNWRNRKYLVKISEQLKEYFHNLTNPPEEAWESVSYEQNQNMPDSGY